MSVAIAMQQLEAAYPVLPSERSGYPLFFDVGALDDSLRCSAPVSSAWLTRRFEVLMKLAIGQHQAAERSWHSWRVTLACALRAAVDSEHPDGRGLDVIKLFGRWRSDAAVKLYARLTPDAYAKHVSASLRADAARLSGEGAAEAMQNIDPMDFFGELEGIASAQDETAPQVPKSKAPPPPDPKPKDKPARPPPKEAHVAGERRSGKKPRSKTYVMVPASVFPGESCGENGGEGWTATTSPHRKGIVKVTFTQARDDDGAPFRPVHLKSSCLAPLPQSVGGDPDPDLPPGAPEKGSAKRKRSVRKGGQGTSKASRPSPSGHGLRRTTRVSRG